MATESKPRWTTCAGKTKTWIYGALRVRDGKELTRCAPTRNSKEYIALLAAIEAANPKGDLYLITDNLSSHNSLETRTWMEAHPRLHHVFIPTGACWLNLQEGWWRKIRHEAFAGQSFANPQEIDQARRHQTAQPPRSPLGLEAATQDATSTAASLLLSYLTNGALCTAHQPASRETRL